MVFCLAGYQRILNYAHSDGSFSAFGYFDPSGSMFLTTFVVRVLQEAKSLIFVDDAVLDRAVRWIFEHQLENGCFDTMHHVFQDMVSGSLGFGRAGHPMGIVGGHQHGEQHGRPHILRNSQSV